MNSVVVKFFCRHGSKSWRPATNNGIRMNSSDEKGSLNKIESSPSSPASKICPPPPEPCTSMHQSRAPMDPLTPPPQGSSSIPPQRTCIPDPNNPCNYIPPKCKDPNYPNMTKIKRLQCKFQKDDGLPIFLKKGTSDVILYHATILLTGFSLLMSLYTFFKLDKK